MSDTVNNTFYNRVDGLESFGGTRGIELNGTTPTNHNYFVRCRIANRATGGDYGIYVGNAQGNSFVDISLEPAGITGNTGVYMTTVNCFANIFQNMWIEGNAQGVLIDATPTYNTFSGGTITANTTNFTDNAKYTAVVNAQV